MNPSLEGTITMVRNDDYPEYLLMLYDEFTGYGIDLASNYVYLKLRPVAGGDVVFMQKCVNVLAAYGLVKFTLPSGALNDIELGKYKAEVFIDYRENVYIFNVLGITKASPAAITCDVGMEDYSDVGTHVFISGIVGMTELNNKEFIITGYDGDDITLSDVNGVAVDSTDYAAWVSGGIIYVLSKSQTALNQIKFKIKEDFT